MTLYDLIIIGGGPAGSAAAVYAARKKLKTLFITTEFGGQSIVSDQIYNWIGTTSLSGQELANNLKKHVLANAGDTLTVIENQKVENISKDLEGAPDGGASKSFFSITTGAQEKFFTKTILITTGSGRRKIKAINADRLEHKGLTYCASCDGPIFADMDVAVIGGGNAGFETAAQLLAYCKSVTLINNNDSFQADPITVEKVLQNQKMHTIKNADILEIQGEKFVEGIIYEDKISKEKKELEISGIFVEIGQIPNTNLVKDLVPLDTYNRIIIDPSTQKTKIPGIWAAGDCTDVLYHQNNIAAGDAVRALEDIYLTLNIK
ncbi:MAG: FAD-dependent oxidoreductase [Patescibacteria group bacterium]